MKKLSLLLLSLILLGQTTVVASVSVIEFEVAIIDLRPSGPGSNKSPVRPPQATLDGHTLTFTSSHPDYTLILINGEGEEVYAVTVSAEDTVMVLPGTLCGNYELCLYTGSQYYFVSSVTL